MSLASKDAIGHADVPSIYLGPIVLFDALKTFEVHLPSKLQLHLFSGWHVLDYFHIFPLEKKATKKRLSRGDTGTAFGPRRSALHRSSKMLKVDLTASYLKGGDDRIEWNSEKH